MPGYTVNEDGTLTITDEEAPGLFRPKGPEKPPTSGSYKFRLFARLVAVLGIAAGIVISLMVAFVFPGAEVSLGMSQQDYETNLSNGKWQTSAGMALSSASEYNFDQHLEPLEKCLDRLFSNFTGNASEFVSRLTGATSGRQGEAPRAEISQHQGEDVEGAFGNVSQDESGGHS